MADWKLALGVGDEDTKLFEMLKSKHCSAAQQSEIIDDPLSQDANVISRIY